MDSEREQEQGVTGWQLGLLVQLERKRRCEQRQNKKATEEDMWLAGEPWEAASANTASRPAQQLHHGEEEKWKQEVTSQEYPYEESEGDHKTGKLTVNVQSFRRYSQPTLGDLGFHDTAIE